MAWLRLRILGTDFGGIPRRAVADDSAYWELFEAAKSKHSARAQGNEPSEPRRRSSFFDELALATQATIKSSPLDWSHGPLIYEYCSRRLAALVSGGQANLLDIGSARGFSAICLARALDDSNQGGVVVSLDALAPNTARYWNSVGDHGGPRKRAEILAPWKNFLDKILFVQLLSPVELEILGLERIHFAFVDGDHTAGIVEEELHFICDRQIPGDQILMDDVSTAKFPSIVSLLAKPWIASQYRVESLGSAERGYALLTRV